MSPIFYKHGEDRLATANLNRFVDYAHSPKGSDSAAAAVTLTDSFADIIDNADYLEDDERRKLRRDAEDRGVTSDTIRKAADELGSLDREHLLALQHHDTPEAVGLRQGKAIAKLSPEFLQSLVQDELKRDDTLFQDELKRDYTLWQKNIDLRLRSADGRRDPSSGRRSRWEYFLESASSLVKVHHQARPARPMRPHRHVGRAATRTADQPRTVR